MEKETLIKNVANELNLTQYNIEAVLELTEEGCTIPFIARYRKERTGSLDEVDISNILELFSRMEEREKRREYIIQYLEENGKLTPALKKKLAAAPTLAKLEDIYLPYKPRKKTLADKARELGMEPLAELIKKNNLADAEALKAAEKYTGKDVPEKEAALEHAMNIIVQEVSDSAEVRGEVRESLGKGKVSCGVKKGKEKEGEKFRDYFNFTEEISGMPGHRIMAVLRGEKEGILSLSLGEDGDMDRLAERISKIHFKKKGDLLVKASKESLRRHLMNSLGNEVMKKVKERAEEESVGLFSKNLEKILLFSPFGEKAVIGIDPGIRTGCKTVAIDRNGDFKEYMTLNLHRNELEAKKLLVWAKEYDVAGIAIGDGTFGRETYTIVKQLFKGTAVVVALVDEDGASVYSAGETAREEFPELDATVRGAISIGRRFQDPMAELVKIDPKSLGIGQYQHDVNHTLLKEKLGQTVEWAVNKVGINLNTAGYHLLSYVSGLDKRKAKEITRYRSEHKKIQSSKELKKIKGIGAKAFEQAAGFLRILDGANVLDSTGVHPESYGHVERIAEFCSVSVEELVKNPGLIKKDKVKKALKIPELDSIIDELKQKGLDPREDFKAMEFRDDVQSIDDLTEGMVLNGVVDNVLAFGAFVDIGIKDKGLVHISEVSNSYVEDITSVLSIGDEVEVRVLGVDLERKRISLSIKQAANPEARRVG
ncbi:MAG: S1 RNA-binding domain-containing protein [bacterium]|nr:S1 RNA-binding domain-containing protein [bacterium]